MTEVILNDECAHCNDKECHDGEHFCNQAMKENSFYKSAKLYKGLEVIHRPTYEELEKENAELEAQIEKLIDFVLSKTECCDVCPMTDTCINSEGTCPYAGILAKGEEEVTREWLMQFISRR